MSCGVGYYCKTCDKRTSTFKIDVQVLRNLWRHNYSIERVFQALAGFMDIYQGGQDITQLFRFVVEHKNHMTYLNDDSGCGWRLDHPDLEMTGWFAISADSPCTSLELVKRCAWLAYQAGPDRDKYRDETERTLWAGMRVNEDAMVLDCSNFFQVQVFFHMRWDTLIVSWYYHGTLMPCGWVAEYKTYECLVETAYKQLLQEKQHGHTPGHSRQQNGHPPG